MNTFLTIGGLLPLLALAGRGVAQGGDAAMRPLEVFRIIESFPEDGIGEWHVGGMTFLATADTDFDYDRPPGIGVIAEVDYVVRDGVNVALQIEPQKRVPARELTDGPYLLWKGADAVELLSICRGEIQREGRPVEGEIELVSPCEGLPVMRIEPAPYAPPQAEFPAANRVFVVSDIEGYYATVRGVLTAAGVVDLEGHWDFGDGHLVFLGDSVDRGDGVTETLWAIRRWQDEAREAGGHVHFLLGNHEAKLLNGWTDDTHLKYHYIAARMGMQVEDLYGPDTELGRWIRNAPTVVRIGDLLFVHGGFAPGTLTAGLDVDGWNEMVRAKFAEAPVGVLDAVSRGQDPVWGPRSPLWYRGYFEDQERDYGPRPTVAAIDAQLAHFGAKHMIVGHTRVDTVRALYPEARVVGTNVRWRKPDEARGLLIDHGRFWQVDRLGRRSAID